jgi:hypothetical protein
MDQTKQYGENPAEVWKTKSDLFKRILELTCQQPALMNEDDIDGLNKCIAARGMLAAEIDRINNDTGRQFTGLPPETAKYEAEIQKTMLAIQKQDAANIQLAEAKLKEYSSKIKQIRQARKGIESYNMQVGTEDGSFFDKKK